LPNDEAVSKALNNFNKVKSKIPVCGAMLLSSDMNQCVLVKGWIAGSAWGFPKGKIDQGEDLMDCATREVLEETGFDATGHIQPEDYIEHQVKGQTMRLYIARDVPADYMFETKTRKEISEIRWFEVDGLVSGKAMAKGDRFSNTGQSFIGGLATWIEAHRPEGYVKPVKEKKSKKKKSKKEKESQDEPQPSNSKGKGGKGGKGDVTTFGHGGDDGWSLDDMFQVNEEKFGVVNSFNYEDYTVALPDAAAQAAIMADYEAKNGKLGGKGKGRGRGKTVSPQMQPQQKKHAAMGQDEGKTPLAPSVANIFALAAQQPPAPVEKPAMEASSATKTCSATEAPAFSFTFNTEEILSCI
jgi:8-oxo-dGTP pyrophosphatase MutT (NUDIX family)